MLQHSLQLPVKPMCILYNTHCEFSVILVFLRTIIHKNLTLVVRLTVIKAKTRPGIEARYRQECMKRRGHATHYVCIINIIDESAGYVSQPPTN